jgi:hypothetical protein
MRSSIGCPAPWTGERIPRQHRFAVCDYSPQTVLSESPAPAASGSGWEDDAKGHGLRFMKRSRIFGGGLVLAGRMAWRNWAVDERGEFVFDDEFHGVRCAAIGDGEWCFERADNELCEGNGVLGEWRNGLADAWERVGVWRDVQQPVGLLLLGTR